MGNATSHGAAGVGGGAIGARVIPKSKVKKVEKAVRAAGRDKAMLKKAKMR